MFEKCVVLPPWSEKQKQAICLPWKSQEENLSRCEEILTQVILKKFSKTHTKEKPFKLPIRANDVQRDYFMTHELCDPPLFLIIKSYDVSLEDFLYDIIEKRNRVRSITLEKLEKEIRGERKIEVLEKFDKEDLVYFKD